MKEVEQEVDEAAQDRTRSGRKREAGMGGDKLRTRSAAGGGSVPWQHERVHRHRARLQAAGFLFAEPLAM